jgi:hypothetical protein
MTQGLCTPNLKATTVRWFDSVVKKLTEIERECGRDRVIRGLTAKSRPTAEAACSAKLENDPVFGTNGRPVNGRASEASFG